jgi:hypothetical protein
MFRNDLRNGIIGEDFFLGIHRQMCPNDEIQTSIRTKKFSDYDFKINGIPYECKRDMSCYKYPARNIAIEYSCKNVDSGLNITKAEYFIFVVDKPDKKADLFKVSTGYLKNTCPNFKKMTCNRGTSNETKCYLIPVEHFMNDSFYLGEYPFEESRF